jgi:hypothetical protein
MKEIHKWECEVCNSSHPSKEAAEACEKKMPKKVKLPVLNGKPDERMGEWALGDIFIHPYSAQYGQVIGSILDEHYLWPKLRFSTGLETTTKEEAYYIRYAPVSEVQSLMEFFAEALRVQADRRVQIDRLSRLMKG